MTPFRWLAAPLLCSVGVCVASDTYTLKFASFVPAPHAMSEWIETWVAELEVQSAGRLIFETLHGAQMGPPVYYDLAANAQADVTWILHGATPGRFPLTKITNLPLLFCSAEQATRVINDERVRAITDIEHRGVKVLATFMHPTGQILMRSEAVLAIDYGGAGLAFQLGPFLSDITEVYAYTSSFALVMNPDSFA